MTPVEFFTSERSIPGDAGPAARLAEDSGFAGMTFSDSQSLSGDPYVAMATAAAVTSTLKLATGVTNPLTRNPVVTAGAIAAVDVVSGGRAELGVGRGDSSLAHLGLAPVSVAALATFLSVVRRLLHSEYVPIAEVTSSGAGGIGASLPLAEAPERTRLEWLAQNHPDRPPVPTFVSASGEKVIRLAAQHADRVVFALGADPHRLKWGIDLARSVNPHARLGAFVNIIVDDDVDRGIALAAGSITSFARFSAMHGRLNGPAAEQDRKVMEQIPHRYQMTNHFRSDNQASESARAIADRFAIVGPPSYCRERLIELAELGIDRFQVVGPDRDSDPDDAMRARTRLAAGVLSAGFTASDR